MKQIYKMWFLGLRDPAFKKLVPEQPDTATPVDSLVRGALYGVDCFKRVI